MPTQPNHIHMIETEEPKQMKMTWDQNMVTITTQCGSQFFSPGLNVTWTAPNIYTIDCANVQATILQQIWSWYGNWCPWSNQPSQPYFQGQTGIYCNQCDQSCGMGTCFWGHQNTLGCIAWKGQQNNKWQFCTVDNTPIQVIRHQVDAQELGFQVLYQSNPYLRMPDGYYKSQGRQIIVTDGNQGLNQGNVAFNSTVQQMAMTHWGGCNPGTYPNVVTVQTTVTSPPTQDCVLTVQMPRNASWVQLNNWCQNATVQMVGNQLTLISNSQPCNVKLGRGVQGFTFVVTVSNQEPYSMGYADVWYCTCSGKCSETGPTQLKNCFHQFDPYLSINVTTVKTPTQSTGQNIVNPFSHFSFFNIIIWALAIIASLIVLSILIGLLVHCIKRSTKN